MAAPPWTLAVALASASIVLTSPSPLCNGTPRWATANPLAVRRTKTVKRYWSPRIPKHEGSGAGVPPAPRTPSRESPGASRTKYLWIGDPNESLSSEGRSLPSHPIHAIRANIFPNSRLHPPDIVSGGFFFQIFGGSPPAPLLLNSPPHEVDTNVDSDPPRSPR